MDVDTRSATLIDSSNSDGSGFGTFPTERSRPSSHGETVFGGCRGFDGPEPSASLDEQPVPLACHPTRGSANVTSRVPSRQDPSVDRRNADPDELADAKRRAGSRVSVVIPARDEETTVGLVAGRLIATLQRRSGLVDEVLVVDADSRDRTGAVAERAGARVVRQADVLPDQGTHVGKGEAMWKGLAASTGDLVVFVDADIVGIDERFVTELLAPLLADPDVALVKAAYDRPLRTGDHVAPTGGGRVTELLARPLLASLWPELAWLTQPLAGECAARRPLLESLPFVRGYGVELAMLVDVAASLGPSAIREVDLGRREHVHQSLDALGRMAAEILQVALQRAASQGRLTLDRPLGGSLPQPSRRADGSVARLEYPLDIAERPPLRSVRSG